MRWVTFHYNIMDNQIADFQIHPDKQTALKYFNKNCNRWFGTNTKCKAEKLPATYGFFHRKYYGISARAFKQMFEISIDEALEEQNE